MFYRGNCGNVGMFIRVFPWLRKNGEWTSRCCPMFAVKYVFLGKLKIFAIFRFCRLISEWNYLKKLKKKKKYKIPWNLIFYRKKFCNVWGLYCVFHTQHSPGIHTKSTPTNVNRYPHKTHLNKNFSLDTLQSNLKKGISHLRSEECGWIFKKPRIAVSGSNPRSIPLEQKDLSPFPREF